MYTPTKDDFEFITDRDITVDKNFASQGYWKGVAVHFFRNKFAVTGLILVGLIFIFAVFAPIVSTYSYQEIISVTDSAGKEITAKSLSPQFAGSADNLFSDKTFLFLTIQMIRETTVKISTAISRTSVGIARKLKSAIINKIIII